MNAYRLVDDLHPFATLTGVRIQAQRTTGKVDMTHYAMLTEQCRLQAFQVLDPIAAGRAVFH